MESDDTEDRRDAAAARAALDSTSYVADTVTNRLRAPWWYHVVLGLAPALVFASVSLGGEYGVLAAAAGALSGGLAMYMSQRRGTSVDRNRIARGAVGAWAAYIALIVVLAVVGLYLEFGIDLRWSMAVAGAVLVAPGIAVSYRNDVALLAQVRSGS